MFIITRSSTRKNLEVPFFNQYMLGPRPWTLMHITRALKPKFRRYEPRYSADLLTKITIFEFDEQQILDSWNDSIEVKIRNWYLNQHNTDNEIEMIENLRDLSMEESQKYHEEIINNTWPKSCLVLSVIPGVGPDRFRSNATKPENDHMIFDPAYLSA